jgi:hypothetical protein
MKNNQKKVTFLHSDFQFWIIIEKTSDMNALNLLNIINL